MSTKATTTSSKTTTKRNSAKKSAQNASSKKVVSSTPAKTAKPVTHNKRFPVVKASRTEMVNVINSTKGRFFTCTHIDKEGNARTMNVIKSNKPASELGYILVYSLQDKGYRNLNPQTLTDVSFKGNHYQAKTKPRTVKVAA